MQTAASPPPGEKVRVRMLNADETCTEISAVVARRHVVPRRLASVANSGIGLRVESGSAELARFAESCPPLQENASPRVAEMLPPGPAAEEIPYRVRARQVAGTHSKTLRVTAESEEKARSLALSSLDYGWEILSVDPVGS